MATGIKLSTVIRALGEHDDYQTLTDVASEYGEPGYTTRGGPVLLGDWWCRAKDCDYTETYDNGDKKVHGMEYHYPRVFAFLEEQGCEMEWYDEWTMIYEVDKCYRTSEDSYSWQPTAVWNEDIGEYMIPPADGGDDPSVWVEWAVNDATRCLMTHSLTDEELAAEGFTERECGFESGWYGVEDNPPKILAAIQEREPGIDVLFKLSGVEQFRVKWCVYARVAPAVVARRIGAEHGEEDAEEWVSVPTDDRGPLPEPDWDREDRAGMDGEWLGGPEDWSMSEIIDLQGEYETAYREARDDTIKRETLGE